MGSVTPPAAGDAPQKGFLKWIERVGNALPDPVVLFFWLIVLSLLTNLLIFYYFYPFSLSMISCFILL